MNERLETTASAAALAGITPSGIIKAGDRGQLTVAARTTSGQRLYRRADVESYVEKNRPRRQQKAAV